MLERSFDRGEQLRLGEPSEAQERIAVDRVFPYFIPSSERIIEYLREGKEPPLLKVLLGVKPEESLPSPAALTPISGRKVKSGHLDSAFDILHDKTTISPAPLVDRYKGDYYYRGTTSFTYKINHPEYPEQRVVTIVSIPVLSPQIARNHRLSDFQDMISLTKDELSEVFDNGFLNDEGGERQLIESSARIDLRGEIDLGKSPDEIEGNLRKKRKQLNYLVGFLGRVEEKIRGQVLARLESSLGTEALSFLDAYVSLCMTKGQEEAEVSIKQAVDSIRAEIDSVYFQATEQEVSDKDRQILSKIKELALSESPTNVQQRLHFKAELLKSLFSKNNYGVDILHLLPLIVKTDPQVSTTTETAKVFISLLQDIFTVAVDRAKLDQAVTAERIVISQEMFLSEKAPALSELQDSVLNVVAEAFGMSVDFVRDAWNSSLRQIQNLADEVKNLDPKLRSKFFQVHDTRMGEKDIVEDIVTTLLSKDSIARFESYRQLFFFLKSLLALEEYKKKIRQRNRPFRLAVDSYFGNKLDRAGQIIEYKGKEFDIREVGDLKIIVDRKQAKTFESYARKSFTDSLKDIKDTFSTSIVLVSAGDKERAEKTKDGKAKVRIAEMQRLLEGFIEHIKTQFPGWVLKIDTDKHEFENYEKYLAGEIDENKLRTRQQRREGSNADLIVRRKIVLSLTSPEGTEDTCEFTFYPFLSLSNFESQHAEAGFMGWWEKLDDDEKYIVRRMLNPIIGTLGLRSLYDYFFPDEFYAGFKEPMRVSGTIFDSEREKRGRKSNSYQ